MPDATKGETGEFLDYDGKSGGLVIRKNGRTGGDNRDKIHFSVCIPPEYLIGDSALTVGSCFPDPYLACGDKLDLGDRGVYIVRRISFLYRHSGGRLVVTSKKLFVEPIKLGAGLGYLQ